MSTAPDPSPTTPQTEVPRDSPEPHGPGVVRRTTSTIKRVLLLMIGGVIALFAVFNSQSVEVNWIFGDAIQTPLILAIAVTLAAGIAIGWISAKLGSRHG